MKTFFNTFLTLVFLALVSLSCKDKKGEAAVAGSPLAIYEVESLTNHEFTFNGGEFKDAENPEITLKRGETYQFKVETFGHPFFIKTEQVTGKDKVYDKGIIENGTEYGTITFVVPKDAPSVLFYICKFHKMMTGKIKIID